MRFLNSFFNESDLLKKIRTDAESKKIPILSYNSARFLEALCFVKNPESILEIGCGIGYSSYFLIKNFKNLLESEDSILKNSLKILKNNNANDNIGNSNKNCLIYTGIDMNKERLKEASFFIERMFPEFNKYKNIKIEFICSNILKIIDKIKTFYDMVFIDAAKFEYGIYIKSIEKNLKNGSVVIADNIFYSNKIYSKEISKHDKNSVNGIKEYLSYIYTNPYFNTALFDIGDGLSVSVYNKFSK